MNKRRWLILAAALALLTGCAAAEKEEPYPRAVENETVSVMLDTPTEAVFTGTAESPELRTGTLTGAEGWRFEGTLRERELLDGQARELPRRMTLGGEERTVRYTGPLADGKAAGEGSIVTEDGASFTGTFANDAPADGEAADLPMTLEWFESLYEGVYTGPIRDGLPQGQGAFTGFNAARQRLSWTGGWSAGAPEGAGQLTADRLLTTVEGRTRAGSYGGDGLAAVPEGEGAFSSVDDEGVTFTYAGQWHEGLMDGQGSMLFHAEDHFDREGTFSAGRFVPTWREALSTIGTVEPRFTITDEQWEFIEQYPALWESEDHWGFENSGYFRYLNHQRSLWDLFQKPLDPEPAQWLRVYGLRAMSSSIVQFSEDGPVFTCIFAGGMEYRYMTLLIVPQEILPMRRGSIIHAYFIPLGMSEYVTVFGETRPCAVLLVGDMYMSK